MANEITVSVRTSVANGSVTYQQSHTFQANQTLSGAVVRKQTVPTSDTVIVLTGVTAAKFVQIKNLDATNYIDIGSTVAGAIAPLIRLAAGQSCSFPLVPTTVIRGQANTASVIIEYLLTET